MGARRDSPWPERDEELKRLYFDERLKPTAIAERMGFPNRNIVIGRITRLGFPKLDGSARDQTHCFRIGQRNPSEKEVPALPPLPPPDEPGTAYVRTSVYARPVKVVVANGKPRPHKPAPKAPPMPRLFGRVARCEAVMGRFVDLENDGKCGKDTMPGAPYCEDHCKAFYVAKHPPRQPKEHDTRSVLPRSVLPRSVHHQEDMGGWDRFGDGA